MEQPHLGLVASDGELVVQGSFLLRGGGEAFDQFQVQILVPAGFPDCEPKVFETGNRILPKNETRHINPDSACCLGVWEEWLAQTNDPSFRGFLKGPVNDYFLSQFFFERDGTWRLGERSHGAKGLIEAYAHVLSVEARTQIVLSYLQAITRDWPKGHLPLSVRKQSNCSEVPQTRAVGAS